MFCWPRMCDADAWLYLRAAPENEVWRPCWRPCARMARRQIRRPTSDDCPSGQRNRWATVVTNPRPILHPNLALRTQVCGSNRPFRAARASSRGRRASSRVIRLLISREMQTESSWLSAGVTGPACRAIGSRRQGLVSLGTEWSPHRSLGRGIRTQRHGVSALAGRSAGRSRLSAFFRNAVSTEVWPRIELDPSPPGAPTASPIGYNHERVHLSDGRVHERRYPDTLRN